MNCITILTSLFISCVTVEALQTSTISDWSIVGQGPFSKREGLMGVSEYNGYMFLSGGREAFGVRFNDEIWRSIDGKEWELVSKGVIGRRAYHSHVVFNDCMYILGGQTFFKHYNDVWESCDGMGKTWNLVTSNAEWGARTGMAAVVTSSNELIIAGGSYEKDDYPFYRFFYNDVWASTDGGKTWELRNSQTEWSARSGPRLIEDKNRRLLLIAGEVGFKTDQQLVDIWGSEDDGRSWYLVSENPGFSKRSGHGVVVTPKNKYIVLIGGWPYMHDMWLSKDNGETFQLISDSVWNCQDFSCGKFDFLMLIHNGQLFTIGGSGAYGTFGKLSHETWVADITEEDVENTLEEKVKVNILSF
jgi:hypothetical protein